MPIGGLIAGGLGLAGSVGGSLIQSSAAKNASNAQVQLGQQALSLQKSLGQQGLDTLLKMFGTAQDTLSPIIDTGKAAGSTLLKLLTPGASQTNVLSQIPGFQFAQDWGQKAVQNIGTTTGLGGNVLKAGADYATGVAQQGFGNIVQYLQNVFSTGAGGANALAAAASGTGQSAFSNLNQEGATIGGTTTGIGNATASGILGSGNALAGGITGGTSAITNSLLLSKLFGGAGGAPGVTSGGGIYGAVGPTSVNGNPLVAAG